jgi:predicted AAA+ superfamily ATPase
LQHVVRRLNVEPEDCWFWATHQGAELDLLVVRGRRRLGFEIKHTDAPGVTKSMRIALAELGLERLDVIHVGRETYPLGERIRAVSIERVRDDVERFGR